ncbi:MAG: putative sulfate exporter family transporter [Legionellales bacterium]|jgi:uncharacterized integral membrane protein (TIGR00698 family)
MHAYLFGITLSALLATIALWLATLFPALAISPLIIGVLLGLIIGNLFGKPLHTRTQKGLGICTKQILRLGVILYGFRITVDGLFAVGWIGLGLSLFVTISTLYLGCYLGEKLFKLDKQTSFLTAIGAAICGAAAVLAAETTTRAKSHQAAVAVATVVLFGTLAMLLYPAALLVLSPWQYGFFTGGSIHEVAQVLAAGEAGGSASAEIAVIVKMTRVLLLAPILILAGIYFNKISTDSKRPALYIPWFVLGFIICIGINSLRVVSFAHTEMIQAFDLFLLTMAMSALGLNTQFKALATLGLKPFYLGGALWLWLMISTFAVVILFV